MPTIQAVLVKLKISIFNNSRKESSEAAAEIQARFGAVGKRIYDRRKINDTRN